MTSFPQKSDYFYSHFSQKFDFLLPTSFNQKSDYFYFHFSQKFDFQLPIFYY